MPCMLAVASAAEASTNGPTRMSLGRRLMREWDNAASAQALQADMCTGSATAQFFMFISTGSLACKDVA